MSNGTTIEFSSILERDMDLFLVNKISYDKEFLRRLFLSQIGYKDKDFTVQKIARSVFTEDGETDVEVILAIGDKRIALLLEDKIDAPAMEDQAGRYHKRGNDAVKNKKYDEYHVFIVAPEKYLKGNQEAQKYPHKVSYEAIKETIPEENAFELAVIDHALEISRHSYVRNYNEQITVFWDRIYDFAEENYPGKFKIHGQKGLARSGALGQWISIDCNNRMGIQIKSDRGYADLEIKNYAHRFEDFCRDNKPLIDDKKLYIRTASKSLAFRKYIDCIDFSKPFEEQLPALKTVFDAANELQNLIKDLRIR